LRKATAVCTGCKFVLRIDVARREPFFANRPPTGRQNRRNLPLHGSHLDDYPSLACFSHSRKPLPHGGPSRGLRNPVRMTSVSC
jgi:hypothetical protein